MPTLKQLSIVSNQNIKRTIQLFQHTFPSPNNKMQLEQLKLTQLKKTIREFSYDDLNELLFH